MRMRSIVSITIIQLVILLNCIQLLGANDGDIKNCLIPHKSNNCSCCKSGYRGQTCSDVCQHCLTRNVRDWECTYYCETGYYGNTCNIKCPDTCAAGINGPNLCMEKHGLPICVECIPGFYGKQCDQTCDTNCQERSCYQADGKCLSCSSNEFYGDHCKLPCNKWCMSGTCNRTGHCTHGCKFGFYGEQCESLCGSNCQQGKCTSHGYHAYNCTEGCNGGYWGTSCLEKCPNHCTECKQQSGRCTLCMENYVQESETGKCVTEGKPAVVIIVIVVIVVIILSGTIIMVIWTKRRHRHRALAGRYTEEYGLRSYFSDNFRQPEQVPLLPVNQGGEGVRNSGKVNLNHVLNTFGSHLEYTLSDLYLVPEVS